MLLVGDLRFLCSLVVVVVGWLLARWKWRRWVARNAEIRRRMALAREESDRIEFEAAAGYSSYGPAPAAEPVAEEHVIGWGWSPGRSPSQQQCEVCFRPTTKLCKQCKAVRYCSKKCQTIHWLQGHKDECRSVTTCQNIDKGVHSCSEEFKKDEIQSSQNVIGIEGTHTTESVESASGERMFSSPFPHLPSKNNETEKEASQVLKRTDIDVKASVHSPPDEFSSSSSSTDMSVASDSNLKNSNRSEGQSTFTNVESMKPLLSEQPSTTNPKYGMAASSFSNQLKSGCIQTDEKSEFSTSSGCTAADSQHSLLEMSTSSSDFWGGTVESIRSKTDALDEFADVNMSNSRSSCIPSSGRINVHVKVLGSDMNRVMADDTCPVPSVPKASTLSEVCEDGLKFRGPLSLSCKLPGQHGVSNASSECSPKEEAKLSSSDACQAHISGGHVPRKHAINISSLQYSACKQLDHEIDLTNGILDAKKCQQNDSLRLRSSDAHLSSSTVTRKPAVLNVKSVESECAHRDGACSLDSSGHVPCARSGTNPSERRVMDQFRPSNFIRQGTLGAGNGITRYEGSFPYELFVKLYTWKERELCPSGLINCGNSCYANAILQCLTFTPPLTAYFLQGFHAKTCQKKEWCFTCEFEMLVKKAKEGNSPLSPSRLMSQMQRLGSHMGNGKQEDAHEFLRCAIDAMQFVCLKEVGVHVAGSLDEETTLLGLTFGGYLQSKIECMGCGGTSKQHERIMDLTVEIGGEIETLEDSLTLFTRSEILDGENKYYCRRCNSYEQAEKKLRVSEAPNVLTIALKRFQLGTFGKLNKAVKFPEVLNLAPYMSGTSDKCPIYQLYGIVVHLDVMNSAVSGHYVCYIKNNEGRWFKADDRMVRAVELENVLSQEAYMLFYARCSPRAPRLLRSSIIHRDPRKAKNPSLKFKSHPAEPWDVSGRTKPCNRRSHQSHHPTRSNSEDDSSSSSSESSSSLFSEVASHSTDSSHSECSSTNESSDQTLGETGNFWNNAPSPSSFSFTLHSRHSPLGDLDRYSSDAETGSSCSINI
ncbi:Ubiquitin carboxyl-terminal hydrolase 16 [Sesamum alatum]|uniref:ubiquitinyl hydrolase 1 n=1 Tax=Sesamum alatum TaxID=300844 RepID=A0AAE1YQC1_9LAMI|nr:Ubiquitin carboxyl-terminal hydrolase 16 [Sesamum alatum]